MVTPRQERIQKKREVAKNRTEKYQAAISSVENFLSSATLEEKSVPWDSLLERKRYKTKKPTKRKLGRKPRKPTRAPYPEKPSEDEERFQAEVTLWDKLTGKADGKRTEKHEYYRRCIKNWENRCKGVDRKYEDGLKQWESDLAEYQSDVAAAEADYMAELEEWELKKAKFKKREDSRLSKIRGLRRGLKKGDPDAVEYAAAHALDNLAWPVSFRKKTAVAFVPEEDVLYLQVRLPDKSKMPSVKTEKYVSTRDEYDQKELSKTARDKLYDSFLHQAAVYILVQVTNYVGRHVNELRLNGFVNALDPATGQRKEKLILSIITSPSELEGIKFDKVDPKACYRELGGISAAKLSSLTPIKPVFSFPSEDHRFTEAYEVARDLSNEVNIAAMDWEDFEHLVREVFEKEFAEKGANVNVTHASRDGGVDAIIHDETPITGGKTVIQAKRYTMTVGVAAVRELYGVIQDEGANKGILITTSQFGGDAHQFARNKPLDLIDGNGLLYLLQKHGHEARIDLKEARDILGLT